MYDLSIIGGGPGGYTCAIRAAQLGAKVCLVEENGLGGTCTQRGCIPTKYLHSIGDIVRRASRSRTSGLNADIKLDYKILKSKMGATVNRLASGIRQLLEANGVKLIEGRADLVSTNAITVHNTEIRTKNIVIATGSFPVCLPGYEFGPNLLSSSSVLELDYQPRSLTIIGAGYSGCEFASILNALGCKITLLEAEDHIMPFQIEEIGRMIEKYMTLDGVRVQTNAKVERIVDGIVTVSGEKIESENTLVTVGRKPNINRDQLNNLGIKFNKNGINVNTEMRTSIPNIYAVGDVTGLYELAHVASKQGEIAAENIIRNEDKQIDYRTVPVCVFTYPEVAFVGELSGESGEFPLTASAKANCLGDTRGLVKVYERQGKLVGTYIIAPHAGEIIGEAALAIKLRLSSKDIFDTMHAHPTLPESYAEAARDITNECIHLPK
jgi:dihydrolipoyl dehydrogenase